MSQTLQDIKMKLFKIKEIRDAIALYYKMSNDKKILSDKVLSDKEKENINRIRNGLNKLNYPYEIEDIEDVQYLLHNNESEITRNIRKAEIYYSTKLKIHYGEIENNGEPCMTDCVEKNLCSRFFGCNRGTYCKDRNDQEFKCRKKNESDVLSSMNEEDKNEYDDFETYIKYKNNDVQLERITKQIKKRSANMNKKLLRNKLDIKKQNQETSNINDTMTRNISRLTDEELEEDFQSLD